MKTLDTRIAELQVLLVEDDEIMRVSIEDRLRIEGVCVIVAGDIATAKTCLRRGDIDLVVTDIRLPDGSGADLFQEISERNPGTPVIVMTAYGSVPQAVELVKAGAVDYLTKPFEIDAFVSRVQRSLSRISDARLAGEITGIDGIQFKAGSGVLGKSTEMRRIERLIQRIRDTDSSVMITGESGVGKEVVATLIHQNSQRANGPHIKVNCAAIPANLVESELFGHEKGAFTGAGQQRIGRFEQAGGGTIFLDEIAEIPTETQVKLLRVLQERIIERVGSGKSIALDVRIITATQVDLEKAIRKGTFRSDLFWRLNVIHIHIPPLRERIDDVVYLARLFASRQAAEMGKTITGLSPEAEGWLLEQSYPGNVRELRNMIERAMALCDGTRLELHDFLSFEEEPELREAPSLKGAVKEAEIHAIHAALARNDGAIAKAAKALGVSRKNLWEKMKRYDIKN